MKHKVIIDKDELEKDTFMPADEETDVLNMFELEDRDIYTEDGILSKLEDEEIDSKEEGFMLGWISA